MERASGSIGAKRTGSEARIGKSLGAGEYPSPTLPAARGGDEKKNGPVSGAVEAKRYRWLSDQNRCVYDTYQKRPGISYCGSNVFANAV